MGKSDFFRIFIYQQHPPPQIGLVRVLEYLLSKLIRRLLILRVAAQLFAQLVSSAGMKTPLVSTTLTDADIDRIIEMAWEDRTPFDAIQAQFGLSEQEVITVMRREMKPSSWRLWRARVQGRATKHAVLSAVNDARFKSNRQRAVTLNKITKR